MKIIQSYWSNPNEIEPNHLQDYRRNGGWPTEKDHAISWAFSCLKLKQYYGKVHLISDNAGCDWLINKLNLPYSEASNSLNNIRVPKSLWSLGKIFAINSMTEPFIHVDSDFYIWKKFPDRVTKKPVFAQNIEFESHSTLHKIYLPAILDFHSRLTDLPEEIKQSLLYFRKNGIIKAINTGIIGGSDLEFINQYCKKVIAFIQSNDHFEFRSSHLNTIEQLLLYNLQETTNTRVSSLFPIEKNVTETTYIDQVSIHKAPFSKKYIHLLSRSKQKIEFIANLTMKLKYEFPDMYTHIHSIYNQDKPLLHFIPTKNNFEKDYSEIFEMIKKIILKSEKLNLTSLKSFLSRYKKRLEKLNQLNIEHPNNISISYSSSSKILFEPLILSDTAEVFFCKAILPDSFYLEATKKSFENLAKIRYGNVEIPYLISIQTENKIFLKKLSDLNILLTLYSRKKPLSGYQLLENLISQEILPKKLLSKKIILNFIAENIFLNSNLKKYNDKC